MNHPSDQVFQQAASDPKQAIAMGLYLLNEIASALHAIARELVFGNAVGEVVEE